MAIPAPLQNQIIKDVKACIVEEGEDPEQCMIRTAKYHGLTRDQAEEIPDLMDYNSDEEEEE